MPLVYPQTLEEAEEAYSRCCDVDPFPDIAPALLTSSDIQDYVAATGMIFPFSNSKENFKPASYGVGFSGHYLYWDVRDSEEIRQEKTLNAGEKFTLKRNSIVYVELEPYFQLPSYIAARFNLQIKHVYRGLLLGTGPLVDPGYTGKLYIPIHNLTNEDYEITSGESLIWMEFTKLNPNEYWSRIVPPLKRKGIFFPFKTASKDKPLDFFIHRANPNSPILSTMQGVKSEIENVKKESSDLISKTKEINDSAAKATTQFNRAILVAIIAVCITLGISVYQVYTIHYKTLDYLKDYDKKIQDEHLKYMQQQDGITGLKDKINELQEKIKTQEEELKKLRK